MTDLLSQRPHRRRNALTGEWVTVSPQRAQRPWQGEEHPAPGSIGVTYDPDCYLCPGNTRASGNVNPPYTAPWAFDNDFPAVQAGFDAASAAVDGIDPGEPSALFRSEPVAGRCRVLCYHPDHSKTLADMTEQEALAVVRLGFEVRPCASHQWVQVRVGGDDAQCASPRQIQLIRPNCVKELAQQQALRYGGGAAGVQAEEERLVSALSSGRRLDGAGALLGNVAFETLLRRGAIDHLDALTEREQFSAHGPTALRLQRTV